MNTAKLFFLWCSGAVIAVGQQWPGAPLRTALVIGNTAYSPQYASLPNSTKDATDVTRRLTKIGFETQTLLDARADDFEQALSSFARRITASTELALVYYSGHGFQVQGDNYLVPVSFTAQSLQDAQAHAYPLSRILERLGHARVLIVILDACRDNPFRFRSFGLGRGLSAVTTPRGVVIVYATQPGKTASDGEPGTNGTFTGAFLRALDQRTDWSLQEMLQWVTEEVYHRSGGMQLPWFSSGVLGSVYLAGGPVTGGRTVASSTPPAALAAQPAPEVGERRPVTPAAPLDPAGLARSASRPAPTVPAAPGRAETTSTESLPGSLPTAGPRPPAGAPRVNPPPAPPVFSGSAVPPTSATPTQIGYLEQFQRSVARARAGDLQGAEQDIKSVLRIVPRSATAQLQLAAVLALQGRVREAEDLCQVVLKSDGADKTALLVRDFIAAQRK